MWDSPRGYYLVVTKLLFGMMKKFWGWIVLMFVQSWSVPVSVWMWNFPFPGLCVWMIGPWVMVLFWKIVWPVCNGALLEETERQGLRVWWCPMESEISAPWSTRMWRVTSTTLLPPWTNLLWPWAQYALLPLSCFLRSIGHDCVSNKYRKLASRGEFVAEMNVI